MGRGSGGGVRLLVDIVENSALSCGFCGDVDGRDRRRSARLGRRRAVVSEAAGIQRVLRVRMESLRADSVFSRGGYPETTCARGGALQGRCERVFRAGQAGCRPAVALPLSGGCDRADPGARVCAGPPAVRRLEIDPPRRRVEPSQGRGQ